MSDYVRGLSRDYVHKGCGGMTTVSGDDYVMLENPFRQVGLTFCAACRTAAALDQVEWADSGQKISDYRKKLGEGVPFKERMRLTFFATPYEGALRLNLDAKGNPKPGTLQDLEKALGKADIVTRSPLPKDQAEIAAAMQELTTSLLQLVPSHFKGIRAEIRRAAPGARRPLEISISSPDSAGKPTEPDAKVDRAASRLVRLMSPSLRDFPGLSVVMELMEDGRWHNHVRLVQGDGAEPSRTE